MTTQSLNNPMKAIFLGIIQETEMSGAAMLEASRAMIEPGRRSDVATVKIALHSRKHPNLHTRVDEEDAELVSRYRWYVGDRSWTKYVYCSIGGRTVYLHRLITGAPKGAYVDHINHDGLDNRRTNLRICSNRQNMRNRSGVPKSSTTGYIGVHQTRNGMFRARILDNHGKFLSLGVYATVEEAAKVRDKAAIVFYQEFACLNFPEERGS